MAGSRRSAAIISFGQGENPLQREAKDACDCALDARMNWQGAGGPLASRRAFIRADAQARQAPSKGHRQETVATLTLTQRLQDCNASPQD